MQDRSFVTGVKTVGAPPGITYKTLPLDRTSLKASDARTFEGYASRWGEVDFMGDRVKRGAFSATLRQRASRPLLFTHDMARPIGVELSLIEDAVGLRGKWRLSQTRDADDVYALLKDQAINGLSIGFWPRQSEPNDHGGVDLHEIDLAEVSVVSVPALDSARITSVKSAEGGSMTAHDIAALGRRLEARGIVSLTNHRGSLGRRVASAPEIDSLLHGHRQSASVYLADVDLKALPTGIGGTTGLYPEQTTAGTPLPSVLAYLPTIQTADGFISVPIASTPTGAAAVGAATATAGATGRKPEVVVGYSGSPVPMTTIAGHIVCTRSALEDGDQLAELVDRDLRQAVLDALEAEALAGSGTPPSMLGIANWSGVGTVAATSGQDVAALTQAIGQVVTNSRRLPTLIAMSATSWAALVGNAAAQSFAAMLGNAGISLVPTVGLPAGTALVGVAATAPVYTQVGLTVTSGTTDSQFLRNLLTMRGEVRAVVALSKPSAWSKVTGLAVTP